MRLQSSYSLIEGRQKCSTEFKKIKYPPLSPLPAVFILQAQVHYQRPGSLRDLRSILAVPRAALF